MWRWYVGLRYGVLADAVVDELEGFDNTFRGIEHNGGTVRGRWTVYLPDRTFQECFYVDEPWVTSVRVGSRIRVLAHPWRRKVLVQLGP